MSSIYKNIKGVQEVELPDASSGSFGEVVTADLIPYVAGTAEYNLIPSNFRTFTGTGGSASAANKKFIAQTGTSAGGYGVVRSFRSINYKVGQGAIVRMSGRMASGSAQDLTASLTWLEDL